MSLGGAHHILSCDPGISGFFCQLDANSLQAKFFPIPTKQASYVRKSKETNTKTRKRFRLIDDEELKNLVLKLAQPSVTFFALEYQQAFPGGQGSVSTSKIVGTYNLIKGMFMMMPTPLEITRPSQWKKALGLSRRKKGNLPLTRYQRKCRSWELAVTLYPELTEELTPKYKNFDKAESLLICHYGLHFLAPRYGVKNDVDCLADEPALL